MFAHKKIVYSRARFPGAITFALPRGQNATPVSVHSALLRVYERPRRRGTSFQEEEVPGMAGRDELGSGEWGLLQEVRLKLNTLVFVTFVVF